MESGTEWLALEILTGLQKLTCLSLDRTPAAEVLPGTAQVWLEAITAENDFVRERDTPRVRAAFRRLEHQRESWPAPKHFLAALPRVEARALAYEIKPVTPEEAARRLAEIRRINDEPMPDHSPTQKPEREGPPLAEVEADLRKHYGRDGKAAAAGADS